MQIISRALSVLEEVARRPHGGGLVEIANATELPAATCHRLLAALQEDELVDRDPASRRYRPGQALARLAAMVSSTGYGATIEAGMAALRDRWQECFFLAAMIDDAIVSVRSMQTVDPNRMSVSVPLGRRMSPHAAASGKAILAYLPEDQAERVLGAADGLASLTENTITDPEEFQRELDRVREEGYGICDEEAEAGAGAFAVPIVLADGSVHSSLAVIGPRNRLFALRDQGLLDDMKNTARVFASLEEGSGGDSIVPGSESGDDAG